MSNATIDAGPSTFSGLALEVRDAGLLDRRLGYYGTKIGITVAALAAGWVAFVLIGNSWTTLAIAAFLGVMFTQMGFVGHDAGHQQVFASRRNNRLLGLLVGNTLIGLSFSWWIAKHSAHHAHPNEIGRDPDIGDSGIPPDNREGQGPSKTSRFLTRWQAQLFFPLMIFRSTGLHVLGTRKLLRDRSRTSAAELALIALHTVLYLGVILWVLGPLKALAFVGVQQAVFSIYLGCSFAPNHKGMPVLDEGVVMGFARRQVVTARNVSGGAFTTFMLGGLNYQIEHHLFPSMPRPNLKRAQYFVREFCVNDDLRYCEDNLVGSFRQILRHLEGQGMAAVGQS